MSSIREFSPAVIAIFALVFALSGLTYGKSKNEKFPNIKIKNFGQMDERFFRGERPDDGDYSALAALGVKTIIDLTDNSKEYEQPAVERAGLRYINIPMVDKSYPIMEQINAFLEKAKEDLRNAKDSKDVNYIVLFVVNDFAPEGFPLIGGRLDYLAGRPVAALVYQRRLHPINLFVWTTPEKYADKATQQTRQGYSILLWARDGMTYCAISDLAADEMQAFGALLQK